VQRGVHRPPRFRSRVFSTPQRFPGTPGDRGLVSCRSRPWGSPFRAFILVEVACASRRRLLPCSWSPSYLSGDARDLNLRASPTPAPSRGGLALHRSSIAVSDAANRAFPDDLGPAHRDPPVPTASSASKPCSLHEAVRVEGRLPATRPPLLSWASPLQSLAPTEPRDLFTLRPWVRPQQAGVCDDERCYRPASGETATTSRSRRPRRRAITPERPEHARAASRRHLFLPRPWRG
jgi:hypothetical protein